MFSLRSVHTLFLLILFHFNTANPADKSSCSITGVVIDESTAKPVVAARVYLEKSSHEAFTDLNGAYRIDGIKPGRYTIHAELSGYSPFRLEKHTCSAGGTDTINIRMARHGTDASSKGRELNTGIIIGKVFDAVSQMPIAGAMVKISASSAVETSGEDGLFTFMRIPAGTYTLYAEHPDYLSDSTKAVAMSDKSFKRVYFVLKRRLPAEDSTGTISGIVLDSAAGRPLAGASISLFDTDVAASADEAGQFELPRIPAGMYTLMASQWGYETQTATVEVRARETTRREFNLAARAAGIDGRNLTPGTIEGSVTDESKNAIEGATVKIIESGAMMTTDMTGVFRFDSLPPGLYTLAAAFEGFAPSVSSEIYLAPAEAARIDFTLKKLSAAPADTSIPHTAAASIAGMVVDGQKQAPLAGAVVEIVNTGMTAVSNPAGHYELTAVKPGLYTLRFTCSGFKQKTAENIEVKAGMTAIADAALMPSDIAEMERATVRSAAVRTTGASLLKERKEQISFTDAIGAQEISRTGAGNAADAMKSVTGATVVGGRYVYIRGLGEKYTVTLLNGSPLPSPDPDKKAVNMDLFPSAMIENITTYKTFTPNLPAEWGGGVIDITTRAFPDKLSLSASASAAWIDGVTASNRLLDYNGGSLDWLGIDDGSRAMPRILEQYTKLRLDSLLTYYSLNFNSGAYTARLQNGLMDTLKLLDTLVNSFDSVMAPSRHTAPPNQSYSVSLGNTVKLFDNPLGFYAGFAYSNATTLADNGIKRQYSLATGETEPIIEYDLAESEGRNTVLWGALANCSYRIGGDHTLRAIYMYTRNAIDKSSVFRGFYRYFMSEGDQFDPGKAFVSMRLHYIERSINYIQPSGEHSFNGFVLPLTIKWSGSFTAASQNEPNLRDIGYMSRLTPDGADYVIQSNYPEPSHKFRTLGENSLSAKAAIILPFYQWSGDSSTLSLGGGWQRRNRSARERAFYYRSRTYISGNLDRSVPPENYYTGEYRGLRENDATRTGYEWGITFKDDSQDPAQWDGVETVFGGFTMMEIPLVGPVSLIGGVRYERTDMFGASVIERYRDSTIASMDYHDFLPSASLITALPRDMQVRFAYGRTLVRPSMREKSPYLTESFTGGPKYLGNRFLRRSLIDHVDARWEWFFNSGEILTAGAFYKRIHEPIEMSFEINEIFKPVNSDSAADIVGFEIEMRKNLDMLPPLRYFQAAANFTWAWSRIGLDENTRRNPLYMPDEPLSRPFQGQSPYVINAFLNYDNPDIGMEASAQYNLFGERLGELTIPERPYVWEQAQHLLNFTAGKKLGRNLTVKLRLTNLLSFFDGINTDSRFVHYYHGKEYITRENKTDRSYSLGITYSLK